MTFLLDHDVPAEIDRILVQSGHVVTRLAEVLSTTSDDQEVLQYAAAQRLILVTCNRDDFLHLARMRQHCGMIILIRRRTRIMECANILRLIEQASAINAIVDKSPELMRIFDEFVRAVEVKRR